MPRRKFRSVVAWRQARGSRTFSWKRDGGPWVLGTDSASVAGDTRGVVGSLGGAETAVAVLQPATHETQQITTASGHGSPRGRGRLPRPTTRSASWSPSQAGARRADRPRLARLVSTVELPVRPPRLDGEAMLGAASVSGWAGLGILLAAVRLLSRWPPPPSPLADSAHASEFDNWPRDSANARNSHNPRSRRQEQRRPCQQREIRSAQCRNRGLMPRRPR